MGRYSEETGAVRTAEKLFEEAEELKAGVAAPQALTQLLAYIGAVGEEDGTAPRGLLVAQDFQPRILFAAKATPNVKLLKYSFKFDFQQV